MTFRRIAFSLAVIGVAIGASTFATRMEGKSGFDSAIDEDLELLQGKWELLHGEDEGGAPTIRSVREITGNQESLRRYRIATGEKYHEHSMEFELSATGDVRVFTFFPIGESPTKQGRSYVYRVDAENLYDVPGLLQGEEYQNYQETPKVWHWRRVKPEEDDQADDAEARR